MPLQGGYIAHGNDTQRRTQALTQAVQSLKFGLELLRSEYLIMTQVYGASEFPEDLEGLYSLEAGQGDSMIGVVGTAVTDLGDAAGLTALLQRLG